MYSALSSFSFCYIKKIVCVCYNPYITYVNYAGSLFSDAVQDFQKASLNYKTFFFLTFFFLKKKPNRKKINISLKKIVQLSTHQNKLVKYCESTIYRSLNFWRKLFKLLFSTHKISFKICRPKLKIELSKIPIRASVLFCQPLSFYFL